MPGATVSQTDNMLLLRCNTSTQDCPRRQYNASVMMPPTKHCSGRLCNASVMMSPTQDCPGRLFLNRSLLSARDVEDVVRLAQNAPHGSAYGFTVNLSTKTGRMTSLEVGPGKPQARLHVHDVTQQNDPDAPCHYYHFNSYKHLNEVGVRTCFVFCCCFNLLLFFFFFFSFSVFHLINCLLV